jgi:hypothetical protein
MTIVDYRCIPYMQTAAYALMEPQRSAAVGPSASTRVSGSVARPCPGRSWSVAAWIGRLRRRPHRSAEWGVRAVGSGEPAWTPRLWGDTDAWGWGGRP